MITKFRPIYFLAFGIITITAAHVTISIDPAGWIAVVPFLIYLRLTEGIKSRLIFLAGLIAAWSVCIAKIVSPPMPYAMVFLYSIPISLFHLPGYLFWDRFKTSKWSVLLFPSVMAVMEWIQYTFTPLASWGVAAYSQSHSLAIMQSVSLFGLAGLSFVIYWVNVSIAECIVSRKTTRITFQLPFIAAIFLVVFGALRLDLSKVQGYDTIKVAAVGTDSDFSGYPLPSKAVNEMVQQNLFNRTTTAANAGAKLVVWNEASTFVLPDEEPLWKDALSSFAKRTSVALVAAYIVPLSETTGQYENKYLFYDASGSLVYSYHKHQPVPGERAENGTEPLKIINVNGVKTGAVICYDYDFPYLAKGYGKLNADVVAVPSSDWRGIDPVHTRMAAFRSVEQGHSILRSTRFGLSAAITPYGEFAAQMSSYDFNDKILLANLPVKGVKTLYAATGDLFVYLCIGFVMLFSISEIRNKSPKGVL